MAKDEIVFAGSADQLIAEFNKIAAAQAKQEAAIKKASKEAKDAAREEARLSREALKIKEQILTEDEKHAKNLQHLIELKRRQKLGQEEYERAVAQEKQRHHENTDAHKKRMNEDVDLQRRATDARKSAMNAMDQYNAKIKNYDELLKTGNITVEEHRRLTSQATSEYRKAEKAQREAGAGAQYMQKAMAVGLTASIGFVTLLVRELESVHKKMQGIVDLSVDVAGAMSKLRINFAADETVSSEELDDVVGGIALRTGTSRDIVAAAAGPALSAKGSKSNKFGFEATEAALMITRDANEAGALTGAIGDFAKMGESQDPRAILSFLMSSQQKMRLLTVDQVAKASAPAVNALTQRGDSAEVGMEIFATLANLSADQSGEQTGTAVVNLAAKLEKAGVAGNTTFERIRTLQNDPAAREKFLSENTFEAKATPAITALLRNEETAQKELGSAQAGISSLAVAQDAANIAAYEKAVPEIRGENTVGGQFAKLRNQSLANIEDFKLRGAESGASEAIREQTFKTIEALPISELRRKELRVGFDTVVESQVAINGADRRAAAFDTSRAVLEKAKGLVPNDSDRFIDEQLKLLGEINSNLLGLRADNNQNEARRRGQGQKAPQLGNDRNQRGQ